VAIYLLGLVEMADVKNVARVYQYLPNGVLANSNNDVD